MIRREGRLPLILHQHPPEEAVVLADLVKDRAIMQAVPRDQPFAIGEADALLTYQSGMRGMTPQSPRPPHWPGRLSWVHFGSTGIDRMPDWLLEPEFVTVSRGAQAEAIAEHVVMMALTFERRFPQILARRHVDWEQAPLGGLAGQTIGLFGFGEIGRAVATRLAPFTTRLIAHSRSGATTGSPHVDAVSFERLLQESDHLVICAPLTNATRGLFNAAALAQMRSGAHLINVARGAIVDQDALREALNDGHLGMASLDVAVPEPPPEGHWLYAHPRVRLTGHLSHSGPLTHQRGHEILARNIAAFLQLQPEAMHGLVVRGVGY